MTPTKCEDCGLDVDAELERRPGVVMVVGKAGEFCACCARGGKSDESAAPLPARGAKR